MIAQHQIWYARKEYLPLRLVYLVQFSFDHTPACSPECIRYGASPVPF